jgi:alpha-beta hydrolase superfamily lysophospholipase
LDTLPPLSSPTGARIHVRRRLANSPRGVVQINHDAAEHGGRYADFASFLATRGFHVYAHDHRGHGRTEAPDAPRGTLGGAAKVEADLFELHELIVREHPGLPVILFGQGAGALMALDFLVGHAPRIAGAALWNMPVAADYPARFLRAMLGWERFRLGSDVPSPTMRRIMAGWNRKAGGGQSGFDWLSDDPAEVEAYVADPDCGFEPSISMWLDLLRMAARAGSPRLLSSLPLHLAAGSEDPATDGGQQVERFAQRLKQAGFSNLVSRVYAGKRHDLVNSLNRNLIWEEFAEWARVVAGPTAKA